MELLKTLIWIVNLLSAVSIIVLVLMQHGKGADMGAAFGSGASGSLFGASGSANFLSRTTAVAAAVFFCTAMGLVYLSGGGKHDLGVMGGKIEQVAPQIPAGAPNKNASGTASKIPE
ncbi:MULTISPECIES: preprotein translocase subunit SecG [Chromobacterium]|jgi:preprotein translocase subunit SecG|uniref:Protein-export membrane protein SecG n=2 Tax=Chromobacterium TaxID=535 RepID=A0A1S1X8P6_9NEIS|nr:MULTISPECIES: preprotein translocase subunit SecG [Chromobacterium]KIA81298.1 preprotein translocase subunit SecG [Chromobacterium piscinae]MBM2882860.1 preprotein translocase subunit SecG [Chromobacterium amazonense]MDE1713093.1 preprotein translocase subunit SecG [Chromobacterium amazonense]MDQ4539626.1 preprotein translocase subunit SecG [Chromobacterium amazonense]OHX15926.1 preprotein translocase subunit SecG [Chromobacterium amazonense]